MSLYDEETKMPMPVIVSFGSQGRPQEIFSHEGPRVPSMEHQSVHDHGYALRSQSVPLHDVHQSSVFTPCASADKIDHPAKKVRVEKENLKCTWETSKLQERIQLLNSLLSALEKKSLFEVQVKDWRNQVDSLKEKCLSQPQTVLLFIGDIGAGKSTLINALLDEWDVVFTSNMAAGTAFPIHVSASADGEFSAHIEFVSETVWRDELDHLLADSRELFDCPDEVAAAAKAKFKAVYGCVPSSSEELTAIFKASLDHKWLGSTVPFQSTTASDLMQEVAAFMRSSSSDTKKGQRWPMIKQIRWCVPGSYLLQQGAVLVDLPGIGDSNPARNYVTKQYLQDCQHVVVVANIVRAVDKKAAKEILGQSFRRQLSLDGKEGSVIFVCTSSDAVNTHELIRDLQLKGDPEYKSLSESADRKQIPRFCARKRNDWVKKEANDKLTDEFKDILLMRESDDQCELPKIRVFTVSSRDYLSIVKPMEFMEPLLFDDADDTEVPRLQSFLVEQCQVAAGSSMTEMSKKLDSVVNNVVACIEYPRSSENPLVKINDLLSDIERHGIEAVQKFSDAIDLPIERSLRSNLKEAITTSFHQRENNLRNFCGREARHPGWFPEFCAAVRRKGEYSKKGKSRIDLNEDLLRPALSVVATSWNQLFSAKRKKSIVRAARDFINHGLSVVEMISNRLGNDMQDLVKLCQTAAKFSANSFEEKSKAAITLCKKNGQREMVESFKNRLKEADVKGAYMNAWEEAKRQRGSGSCTFFILVQCLVDEIGKQEEDAFSAAEQTLMSHVETMKTTLLSEAQQVIDTLSLKLRESLSHLEKVQEALEEDGTEITDLVGKLTMSSDN